MMFESQKSQNHKENTMSPNEATLVKLYASINAKDLEGIFACYHDDASNEGSSNGGKSVQTHFHDIAFHLNEKSDICDMWRMICSKNKRGTKSDLHVEVNRLSIEGETGTAEVVFTYHMRNESRKKSPIGRRVRNPTRSAFIFQDGKIVRQVDTANAALWGSKAFGGLPGFIVGHVGFVRRWLAMRKLRQFVGQNH